VKAIGINILIALGGAFLLGQLQGLLGSHYVMDFLDKNLVSLLIALLAINTASLGIVLTKVRELVDASKGAADFSRTRGEMLFSVKEQIALIFLSLILLTLNQSSWIHDYPKLIEFIQVLVMTCFIYGMIVLYDTAKSIFVILSFNNNRN